MPAQPKIYAYTYRATVTYELNIDAESEDEAFDIMEASHWLKDWAEKDDAEVWLHDVTLAGPDHDDH